MKRKGLILFLIGLISVIAPYGALAQELNARVSINRSKVSNTKGEVFDALEKTITEFLNNQKWKSLKVHQ